MELRVTPWTDADNDAVRALVAEPGLTPQFEKLLGPDRLEHWLADPYCDPALRRIAWHRDTPVAFAYAFLFRAATPPWAALRIGVTEPFRRRGIGTRLYEVQRAELARRMPECREISASAWQPCPDAAGFAARHGLGVMRHFWLMERPDDNLREPAWPDGIQVRGFDGSDRAFADWTDAYNASFARHYHFVPGTIAFARSLASAHGFDPTSVLLAYAGDRCVGFCHDSVHASRGEVATLGVVPEWQGRGLGRALLRWGARWLVDHRALPVTLTVDGQNEQALRLYRSEGFEVVKTRPVWSRFPAAS